MNNQSQSELQKRKQTHELELSKLTEERISLMETKADIQNHLQDAYEVLNTTKEKDDFRETKRLHAEKAIINTKLEINIFNTKKVKREIHVINVELRTIAEEEKDINKKKHADNTRKKAQVKTIRELPSLEDEIIRLQAELKNKNQIINQLNQKISQYKKGALPGNSLASCIVGLIKPTIPTEEWNKIVNQAKEIKKKEEESQRMEN